ncbi:MAG: preprotein translocase subunit SecE [Pseudonocardiales bacterium]|nr:preprotein translocase subunit SecE [Pseudonocardiales bacterium]
MTDIKTKEGSSSPSRRPRDDEERRSFLFVNWFRSLSRFVREIVAEMRKVIWPSRHELVTYTIVVVIFVVVLVAIVAGLDIGFAKLTLWIFG